MANNIIDPRLPAPPVTGTKYEEGLQDYNGNPEMNETVDADTFNSETFYEIGGAEAGALLMPPFNVSIISQTVKVTSGGNQTVDIVVEIEDVAGASEYERRDAV